MAMRSLTFVAAFAVLATAQSSTLQICGWQQARAGVVQDAMYLEGGIRSVGNWVNNAWSNVTIPGSPDGTLYRLSFHQPWSADQDNLQSIFEHLNETTDDAAPVYFDGTMFTNKNEFYTYGGQGYPKVLNTTIYEGVVHAGLHQPNPLATQYPYGISNTYQLPDSITKYITNGAGASIPSENLGYYFSGLRASTNGTLSLYGGGKPNTLVNTMLRVDTSSFGNAQWSQAVLPSQITPRADASMVWVPLGTKGSLVVIGGVPAPSDIYSYLNSTQSTQNNNLGPSFMTSIPVYDVAGQVWYTQQTSGSSPPTTAQACAVVASPKDGSSQQIYLYGGYDGSGMTPPYDTVWVLSLPAFQWTQVSAGNTGHARYAHSCSTPYPNQMFSVGGQGLGTGIPISSNSIIDNFDLNTLQWTGKYDPSSYADYTVPSAVASATQTPNNMDSGLATLMRTPYAGNITHYYPYTTGKDLPNPKPSKKWIVPVVASIVAVLAVAIIAITLWCLCRPAARKRRSEAASHSTHSRGIVARWLGNTQHTLPPKSQISDNTTEIGDGISPAAGAELYGGYFKPVGHAELDVPASPGSRYMSQVTSPVMTPGSHRSAEVEGSSPQSMTPNGFAIRNHHMYPPSIGGHLGSMRSTTVSSPGTDYYPNARSPAQGPVQMSPYELPPNRSNEDLLPIPPADLDLNQSQKGSTDNNSSALSAVSPHSEHGASALVSPTTPFTPTTAIAPSTAVSPTHDEREVHTPTAAGTNRPHHERNASSISSGISQMSPHAPGEEWRRSAATDNSQERQGHARVLSSISSIIPRQTKSAYEENKHVSGGEGDHGTM